MPVSHRASQAAALAAIFLTWAGPAFAQDYGRSPNFLDNLFGGGNNARPQAQGPDDADLTVEINQLRAQVRQLTGTIEQLQYRNQQLEQQVRAMQGGAAPAPGAAPGMPSRGGAQTPPATSYPSSSGNYPSTSGGYPPSASGYPPSGGGYPSSGSGGYPSSGGGSYPPSGGGSYPPSGGGSSPPSASGGYPPPAVVPANPGGRRSDVFDPTQNPAAPGAPRPLGSPDSASHPPPVGAPGGRMAGAPLDLSTGVDPIMTDDQGMLPAPPPRNVNGTGTQVASVQPSAGTARDDFDLAAGYIQRRDYALAENSLRGFLRKYPTDARVADAQFLLGESLYQRQQYRDAAESFLTVTTKFDRSPKAPESLLRLGQALAALGEKETACAAWGEIGRKYSNASTSVKKNVAAEQKRVRC